MNEISRASQKKFLFYLIERMEYFEQKITFIVNSPTINNQQFGRWGYIYE